MGSGPYSLRTLLMSKRVTRLGAVSSTPMSFPSLLMSRIIPGSTRRHFARFSLGLLGRWICFISVHVRDHHKEFLFGYRFHDDLPGLALKVHLDASSSFQDIGTIVRRMLHHTTQVDLRKF